MTLSKVLSNVQSKWTENRQEIGFSIFFACYSHSTDLFGFFVFVLGFFWAEGDNVSGTQLFTHKQKHVAFVKNVTCCTWKNPLTNEALMPFLFHPCFHDMKLVAFWITLCSPSAKALLSHTLDRIIYSPMPSVTIWDLVSLVIDICETPTLLKLFVYWNFILQLTKKIILALVWRKD